MSEQLWGLVWPTPWQWDDISVRIASFEEVLPFVVRHYPSIFPNQTRFHEEKLTDAKRRFYEHADMFLIRAGEAEIGLGIGHPQDWSTYYFRTMAVLPEYRERAVFGTFIKQVLDTLAAAGVERFEFDTAPSNVPLQRVMQRLGSIVTGTLNSERWGMVLRYTTFLAPEARRIFQQQFEAVPAFRRDGGS